ncbi:pitrilysin family protein [Labilibaculum sp. K2S]|uniref:M16 family metallopeptidase n=1 Tax=Labilibaculum sp. K2S TaxID=3056386 RepID=UPI0025A47948|nr:pitrilysin family protein [Labilibaculum sp. K2S]MDM8160790.1 pitrilysin family protein [Labilibaculum sp. K2S]
MVFETHTLSNGIRLIHHAVNANVAHCGIILNTGSRDEKEEEWGIAHYIEHVVFKGTTKRKAYHILSRMEDVGGELNAYTTKEETCIYTTFLDKDYKRAIELISDITFNSVFPEKELEKEKEVILDEINSYKDSPSELIFDDFEELIFKDDPIGRNILGTPKHVKKFKRDDILNFIKNNYHTDQMVISSVGNIEFSKLVKMVEKFFGSIPKSIRTTERKKPNSYEARTQTMIKKTYQRHCVMGNIAYDLNDEKRIPLSLLTNILGGPGMNSRLNLTLRERHGLAYNIEANYTPYADTGVFSIYFGTDKGNLDKCLSLINKEMNLLCTHKLGSGQLKRAKNQMIGQIAISSENNENLMLSIGKSFLLYNRIDSLEELYQKVESITADELLEVANEILNKDLLTTLMYK